MSSACQGGGPSPPSPWSSHPRAAAKDRLAAYVEKAPEGTPVVKVASDVLDATADESDAEYQLTRRFFNSHPEHFKTDRRDGLLWVEPRPGLFHLTAGKQSAGTQDGDGVALTSRKARLERRGMVVEDAERGDLLGALAAKREGTENRWNCFEDSENPGSYLLMPYRTRFNSERRVKGKMRTFDGAWRRAAERHAEGLLLTLTTDPSRYGSIEEQAAGMMDDLGRLRDWIGYNFNGDERPESVVVIEFTDSGLVHAHVAVFGVSYVPQERLSHYWDARRDRAEVVHVYGLRSACGRPVWRWSGSPPARAEGKQRRRPRAYLRKTLRAQLDLSRARVEDVHHAAAALRASTGGDDYERGREWWKFALYWALDLRVATCSPSLKASCEDSDGKSRWTYLGTAGLFEFPGYVQRNATVVNRRREKPPP